MYADSKSHQTRSSPTSLPAASSSPGAAGTPAVSASRIRKEQEKESTNAQGERAGVNTKTVLPPPHTPHVPAHTLRHKDKNSRGDRGETHQQFSWSHSQVLKHTTKKQEKRVAKHAVKSSASPP